MSNEYCPESEITFESAVIEKVETYKYLGQQLKMNNDIKPEILQRIKAGWLAFRANKDLLQNENLDRRTAAHLFNSTVLPALTYAAETWNTTIAEETTLAVAERAMERRMIKVTKYEHVKSEDIRQRSKVKDVVREIYKKKLMWAGHIARLRDNRWTKRALDWLPRGIKRKRGRPPIRWEDPIRKVFGKFWKRMAQDRQRWRCGDLCSWRKQNE